MIFNFINKKKHNHDENKSLFLYKKNLPILISSQLQRSGGSLFTQLFDNHPEILSHPWEVMMYKEGYGDFKAKILKTKKELNKLSINGYRKGKHSKKIHRFYFLNKEFTDDLLKIKNEKELFDIYFDEFFKYWINYKNDIYPKKLITGFSPFFCKESLNKILKANKRLSIVHIYRNPVSWWHSARNFKDKYKNINSVEKYWLVSQKEAIKAKKIFKSRVHILNFDDLIKKRKKVMQYFCKIYSLKFDKNLLYPTFNGKLIENDSTFKDQKIDKFGIIKSVTSRHIKVINKKENYFIETKTSKIIENLNKLKINIK